LFLVFDPTNQPTNQQAGRPTYELCCLTTDSGKLLVLPVLPVWSVLLVSLVSWVSWVVWSVKVMLSRMAGLVKQVGSKLTHHMWHTNHDRHTLYRQTRLAGYVVREVWVSQVLLGKPHNEIVIVGSSRERLADQIVAASQVRTFLVDYMDNNQLDRMDFVLYASKALDPHLTNHLGAQVDKVLSDGSKLVSMKFA
jgi:hypothetical protein